MNGGLSPGPRRQRGLLHLTADLPASAAPHRPQRAAMTPASPAGLPWRLEHRARPWTTNHERRLHHLARARLVAEWRQAFAVLVREAQLPRLERAVVTASQLLANAKSRPDVGACLPAVKAAVDGLVDAGVLEDDDPDHLLELRFTAPAVGGHDALVLLVEVMP